LFQKALDEAGVSEEKQQAIIEQVMRDGSCQNIDDIPEEIRRIFVASSDICADEHVRMQAAMQAFVDNSISKTINFPPDAHPNDIASAYQLAWELNCKGITVYVTGSREKEVLETLSTADSKDIHSTAIEFAPSNQTPVWIEEPDVTQPYFWPETKKPRPRYLPGITFGIDTPVGKTFITVNENGGAQPFEVFINTAKAGSDVAADSEAIGRLISYILRISSPIEPSQRIHEVWRQLSGLGGGRPLGFGPNRVRSLPDGVAQILAEYIEQRAKRFEPQPGAQLNQLFVKDVNSQTGSVKAPDGSFEQRGFKIGDLCPQCGQAAMVNEEGCRKCYACGYSEC
jgi:ribonucleoside-diphosphate reductase alpha chain